MSLLIPSPPPGTTALRNIPAPAKLNLFLHVLGRRSDGYHLLQSAFMLIDWCDRLHFSVRSDGRIARQDLGEPAQQALPAQDLCVRAAQALQAHTGCHWGVDIALDKQIPTEAGLGGGSSDAASTLLALNRLWNLDLPRAELARIGLSLGADVPFFIGGHNAWAEGVGEQLTPIELPAQRFVVVKPSGGASTAQIFGAPALKRDTKPAIISGFAALAEQTASNDANAALWSFGSNDLQAVAQTVCPDISHVLAWLQAKGLQARMTGSGSAVFAPWTEGTDVSDAPPEWQVRTCSNWAVHPLSGWCRG